MLEGQNLMNPPTEYPVGLLPVPYSTDCIRLLTPREITWQASGAASGGDGVKPN
jgi:hypothetical protein